MANFGAHKYYRIIVEEFLAGKSGWGIAEIIPITGGRYIQDRYRRVNGYANPSQSGLVNKFHYITHVGASNVTRTATADEQSFIEATNGSLEAASWTASTVPEHGTIEFSSAVYLPIWLLRGINSSFYITTQITFQYSDNGSDWTDIKTFSDPVNLFDPEDLGEQYDYYTVFVLGDYYIEKPTTMSAYHLPVPIGLHLIANSDYTLNSPIQYKAANSQYVLASSPRSLNTAGLDYLEFRLSGGASNSDPELSLGGLISSFKPWSQEFVLPDNPLGIQVIGGSYNEIGIGSLQTKIDVAGLLWVGWNSSGISPGWAPITRSGRYTIPAAEGTGSGYLVVEVTLPSVVYQDGEYPTYVFNAREELLVDVTPAESASGLVEYACIYLKNTSTLGDTGEVFLHIQENTFSPSSIAIGLDPSGRNGEPNTLADKETAPVGVTFSEYSESNPVSIGVLRDEDYYPIWVRRTIPEYTYSPIQNDFSSIGFKVI